MINLEATSAGAVIAALNAQRRERGIPTVGMVLTLLVITDENNQAQAVAAATTAAREHPMRIIVLIERPGKVPSRLDASVAVGGADGPGDVIIARLHGELSAHPGSVAIPLLLPDTPVVAWWPAKAPHNPAQDAIGRHAQRRITDTSNSAHYLEELGERLDTYAPGDTDLAWTRTTPWRSMLAAALDQPVPRITSVQVFVESRNPSGVLLASWLSARLKVPAKVTHSKGPGITKVVLHTKSGEVVLDRPDGRVAKLTLPGQPTSTVALPRRELAALLSEELRRLDPDEIYAQALKTVDRLEH
jgi:glucose-6-phosphate dehydrogenase assembly protein OpcA